MSSVLGLDIGGTHSRARLVADGHLVAEAVAPSASLTAAGRQPAAQALAGLLGQLGLGAGPELDAICVGTAGSGSPEAQTFLADLFAPLSRSGQLLVVNDARLVLAAAGLEDGVACVAGTGSIAVGMSGRREERSGGWGYLLGDEGSGYWVARQAVRELARRRDAQEPLGGLGQAVLSGAGCADVVSLVQRWHDVPTPATWAALAPEVLDCEDPFSHDVVRQAAEALAEIVADVHGRLGGPENLPVVLAGGLLTGHEGLAAATVQAVREQLPQAPVQVADQPPVAGAVKLAEAMAAALAYEEK